MTEPSENDVRKAETRIIRGRLNALAKADGLTPEERIGVCKAVLTADQRLTELETR